MDVLLRGLLADLERRCSSLQAMLTALPDESLTSAHILEAYQVLELAKRDAAGLRQEPTLTEPTLLPNYMRLFQRLAERAQLVEFMVVPFVARFDDGDRFLTKLAHRLIMESGCPLPKPIVGAISSSYYWTFPSYSVVGVPAGEMNSLLGLPDLCHELGHILLDKFETVLLGRFPDELADHVKAQLSRLHADQRPAGFIGSYVNLFEHWAEDWLLELVSDIIATYLCGPAYGLQHVRLCATDGGSFYFPSFGESSDHPADIARVEAVVAALRIVDSTGAASGLVESWWSSFSSAWGESEPGDYVLAYPHQLITSLATTVVAGCVQLGIQSFLQAKEGSVVSAVSEAWSVFRDDPDGYPEYERAKLHELRRL